MRITPGFRQKFERVLVAGQEVFLRFPAGELDVNHPAMAQNHDEKREAAASVPDRDRAGATPVNLGGFPRREGQGQERRMSLRRAHGSHILFKMVNPPVYPSSLRKRWMI